MQGTPQEAGAGAGAGGTGVAGGGVDAGAGGTGAASQDGLASRIAGLSILKGLLLYGATLAFAGLYAYFMYRIANAPTGKPPGLDSTMIATAAALAGVLGSAFALVTGTSTPVVNAGLKDALDKLDDPNVSLRDKVVVRARRILSFEPGDTDQASWPLTFGIWAYAAVAAGVAAVYILNRGETPPEVKALAIAFAGYVLALVNAAYGIAAKAP
jgi:hypothetical protein